MNEGYHNTELLKTGLLDFVRNRIPDSWIIQWHHTDYIYLMDYNHGKDYVVINADGAQEDERFYCFRTGNPPSKEVIITQLDSLINRYQTGLSNESKQ